MDFDDFYVNCVMSLHLSFLRLGCFKVGGSLKIKKNNFLFPFLCDLLFFLCFYMSSYNISLLVFTQVTNCCFNY